MSQILQIINAISQIEVNTLSKTPVIFDVDNPQLSIKGTPARVVFPMQLGENDGKNMEYISLGNVVSVSWNIADLMLYKPVGSNSRLQSSLPELVAYVGNYVTAFKIQRKLGLQHVTIENIDYEWNQFEYPEGSENEYYGVLMMVQVKEVVT